MDEKSRIDTGIGKRISKSIYRDRADQTYPISKIGRPPGFPFRINWDITHRCNLQCRHCFVINQEKCQRDLPIKDLLTIARKIADAGTFVISIAGGEPLLVEGLQNVLETLSAPRRSIVVATNGHLLTLEMVNYFQQLNNFALQVSLDGAKEETHDYIRGVGSFRKVMKALDIAAREIPITVAFTMTKMNCDQLSDFFLLCLRKKVAAIKIQSFIDAPTVPQRYLCPTDQDLHKAQLALNEFSCEQTDFPIKIFHPFGDALTMDNSGQWQLNIRCPAHNPTECTITPDGSVFPCGAALDSNIAMGNLLMESFINVWHSILSKSEDSGWNNGACKCKSP